MTPAVQFPFLALLLATGILTASAQYPVGDTTTNCAMQSVKLKLRSGSYGWDSERDYNLPMGAFDTQRPCPYNMVCAQKLTAVEGQVATYSEDCWERSRMTEYTEVACNRDLCNLNLTFDKPPIMSRASYRSGSIRCYNHGQLSYMPSYEKLISAEDYTSRHRETMPVSHWSGGMCGAAIYASSDRTAIVHERVLTGDRTQKIALLRLCNRSGCNRDVVRSVAYSGYM